MFDRFRRHPLLSMVLALACLGLGAIGLILWSVDLDAYRGRLGQTLSEAIGRPVRLGATHFSLRNGLSLIVDDVAIGSAAESLEVQIPHLRLRLRFWPLLTRKLTFSRVILDRPTLHFRQRSTLAPDEPPTRLPGRATLEQLERTRIDRLTILNGTFDFEQEASDGSIRRLASRSVTLQMKNLSLTEPISVKAQGELLLATPAAWRLNGTLTPPASNAAWSSGHAKLHAALFGLRPAELLQLAGLDSPPPVRPEGSCDLTLDVAGAPDQGVELGLTLKGEQLQLVGAQDYQRPLRLRNGRLAATWRHSTTGDRLEQLRLQIDDLAMTATVELPSAPNAVASATLGLPPTPLATVARFLPLRPLPALTTALNDPAAGGTITLPEVRFLWGQGAPLQLAAARLQLQDGRAVLPGIGAVHGAELDLAWQERTLEIRTARAQLLGGPSSCQGRLRFPPVGQEAQVELRLDSTVEAAQLRPLLPESWQRRLQLSGSVVTSGSVKGPRSALLLDSVIRFARTSVIFDQLPLKEVDTPGELLLVGTLTPQQLEISHARLLLPWGEARLNGTLARDSNVGYRFAVDVSRLRLTDVPVLAPIQRELAPRGTLTAHIDLQGDRLGLHTLRGSGEIANLGLALWHAVAAIRDGSAHFTLDRHGLDFAGLTARVGDSLLRAKARLDWSPTFRLTLDVDLPKVRASDLIFSSRNLFLEKVRGRLAIDTHGIRFQQIHARIKETTEVVVDGQLANYDQPLVTLNITAPRADIGDVIALWEQDAPSANPHHAPSVGVAINARVEAGTLYGMRFEQAQGTIRFEHGRLIIHPLTLRLGNGTAQVQIATGRLADSFPLLRVSGQVAGVDADRIHNELLKRNGLLTGRLDGDFYLQGELGRFLPTLNGGLAFSVHDGTLRGFAVLARVFSLLNVSQLLKFQLPDMASDGIPFNTVSGTVQLQNGLLRTDDLKVDSEAINLALVGSHDLANDRLDFILGAKPLRTVDKILSSIPLAGWILTGEQKALITAQFRVEGSSQEPKVTAIPITSVSDIVVGILRRTLGLPGKVVNDVKELFQDEKK